MRTSQKDKVWNLYNGPLPDGKTEIVVGLNPLSLPVTPFRKVIKSPEDSLSHEERCCIDRLLKHLNSNKVHYNRAIWLAEDPDARAVRFNKIPMVTIAGKGSLLDAIENHPLAIYGDNIAFPIAGSTETTIENKQGKKEYVSISIEKLVSLPVRGIFAEAKLGSCNSCEELDITRFWDWQKSPCPEKAPEIAPITAISPTPQLPNLTPSTLPNPIVNIVNPPNAPDPTAMAGALSLLGKSEIFRNMSLGEEVSALLQKLASGAISGAQAQQAAKKLTSSSAQESGSGSSGGTSGHLSPSEQHDQLQVIRNAEAGGDITHESAAAKAEKTVGPPPEDKPTDTKDGDKSAKISLEAGPESRAFFPGSRDKPEGDKTGVSRLNVKGMEKIPFGPAGILFHWSASPSIVSTSKWASDLDPTWVVNGNSPGLADLTLTISEADSLKELANATTKMCVPQFIAIGEDATEFNKFLKEFNLDGYKEIFLHKIKTVVDLMTLGVNVRTIWLMSPFKEKIPSHIGSDKYAHFTIKGTYSDPTLLGNTIGPFGQDVPNETIDIYPGGLAFSTTLPKEVVSRVGKIKSLSKKPGYTDWVAQIMGRLVANRIAHYIYHSILRDPSFTDTGHNSSRLPNDIFNANGDTTWEELTNTTVIKESDSPVTLSLTFNDIWENVVHPTNRPKVDKYYPVPPAFE